MDQEQQKQHQIQGAFDALKTVNEGLLTQVMNLQGANYILTTTIKELEAEIKALKSSTPDVAA